MKNTPGERLRWLIKLAAFSTPGIRALAARYRAGRVEANYRAIRRTYDAQPEPPVDAVDMLRLRGGERLRRFRDRPSRPRVLYVGTDAAQDRAGILQGLAAVGEVEPFTQGDGRYGQLAPDGSLSFALARPNGRRLHALLEGAAAEGRPFDLVVGQMWDGYIDGDALGRARDAFGCLVVNVTMDDRHTFAGVRKLGRSLGGRGLVPHVDLVATAAPEAVAWYLKEGCPAVFLPEASDSDLFRPMPDLGKPNPVCFVGSRYGIRGRLVAALRGEGIPVVARGAGWPDGHVPTEEVPALFASSKIVLGVGTIGHSDRLLALKMRDFDGPMSGSCYLTMDNPDLHALYDVGREIVVYRDATDLLAKVRWLLEDEEGREAIAARGRDRARAAHTWKGRFTALLSFLDGARRELTWGAGEPGPPEPEGETWRLMEVAAGPRPKYQ